MWTGSRQGGNVRDAAIPTAVHGLVTGTSPDYLDAHTLPSDDPRRWRAQEWARAMFEDPRSLRRRARLGLLGLLLSPPQPVGRVAGWTVVDDGEDLVRLASANRLTSDQVVVWLTPEAVTLVTAVRYEHPAARLLWPLIATQHRRLAPVVLTRAQSRLQRGRQARPAA